MNMYEHKDWRIGLTAFESVGGEWRMREVQVFPPGSGGPRRQMGKLLTFTETASSEAGIIEKALAYARGGALTSI